MSVRYQLGVSWMSLSCRLGVGWVSVGVTVNQSPQEDGDDFDGNLAAGKDFFEDLTLRSNWKS